MSFQLVELFFIFYFIYLFIFVALILITKHFLSLKRISQVLAHVSNCWRFFWMARWSSSALMGRYRRQSSANRRTADFVTSSRSLIWQRDNRVPRTVPWSTPESTVTDLDSSLSIITFIFRFVWKSHGQSFIWHRTISSYGAASCVGRCRMLLKCLTWPCLFESQYEVFQIGHGLL